MEENNFKYTKTHEWIKIQDDSVHIGITDFAQEAMGDIVYVELPEVGEEFKKGDELSNIESVKAASPIYTPLSGTVLQVNEALNETPELINQNPYETYIVCLRITEKSEINSLLNKDQYDQILKEKKEH